ncbi:hypothetical protein HMPREF6745_0290 [Prevotella sp. oral taxon 472 str. F0295]|jgi:hypothetical protein|nr:hypothetical protein HMPREF6745_0290 [Prevotella sp. oral taxon 472 str. F0295]
MAGLLIVVDILYKLLFPPPAILEELKSKMMVGWLMDKWAVIKTRLSSN